MMASHTYVGGTHGLICRRRNWLYCGRTETWLRVGVGVEAEVGIGEGVDGVAAGAVVVVEEEVAAETMGFGAGVSLWTGVLFVGDAVLL